MTQHLVTLNALTPDRESAFKLQAEIQKICLLYGADVQELVAEQHPALSLVPPLQPEDGVA